MGVEPFDADFVLIIDALLECFRDSFFIDEVFFNIEFLENQ
jgi:hypothetical protein